jgi:hypothetical protein
MRLRTSFKDYYDGAACIGEPDPQDKVYVRKTGVLELEQDLINKLRVELNHRALYDLDLKCRTNNSINRLNCFGAVGFIGFCGKAFPYISIATDRGTQVCWSLTDVQKALSQIKDLSKNEISKFFDKKPGWWSRRKIQTRRENIEEFFALRDKEINPDWWRIFDTPVFCTNHDRVIKNPKLHDMKFARVVDPYQAAQEIDMFLHSILTDHPKPLIEVSDEDRLIGHGFDKWTFRKQADDNTKKRKKRKTKS